MPNASPPTSQVTEASRLSPASLARALALGLTTVLATSAANAGSHPSKPNVLAHTATATRAAPPRPVRATAQIWNVKNCNNNGTDSLRDIVENPTKAQSGDKVNLGELPVLCGMTQSVITLASEIKVQQTDLYLYGPARGTVTISGAGTSRVLHHTGAGTLSLTALTISNGYYHSAVEASGGCIYSSNTGDIFLNHVVVSHCSVVSDNARASGGGIATRNGNVTLISSVVSTNQAQGGETLGGGVYSRSATFAKYSAISGNRAVDGDGGGMSAREGATLIGSTVEENVSRRGGGVQADGAQITVLNSTISGNAASYAWGGLSAGSTTLVANSTIASNSQDTSNYAGALGFWTGSPNYTLTLESSIVANNSASAAHVPADLFFYPGSGSLAGADNVVIASNVTDPTVITVTADPLLGPLQLNGGRTRTHMLSPASPALAKGNVTALWSSITADQRGVGYPRTSGANASVDLGAVQFDNIFAMDFDHFF